MKKINRRILVFSIFFLFTAGLYAADRDDRPGHTGPFSTLIVVLGTAPLDEATPSLDMIRRVETGIRLWEKDPKSLLLFTGGRTAGPVSEARMMARMAFAWGVPAGNVVLEEKSRTTAENARYTAPIARKYPITKTILVSRPTHLPRAISLFEKYPEFKGLRAEATSITREEIENNFNNYLKFHDSERARSILNKILKEFRDARTGSLKKLPVLK